MQPCNTPYSILNYYAAIILLNNFRAKYNLCSIVEYNNVVPCAKKQNLYSLWTGFILNTVLILLQNLNYTENYPFSRWSTLPVVFVMEKYTCVQIFTIGSRFEALFLLHLVLNLFFLGQMLLVRDLTVWGVRFVGRAWNLGNRGIFTCWMQPEGVLFSKNARLAFNTVFLQYFDCFF